MTSSTGWAADDRPDGVAAGADRGTRRGQRRLEDPMGVRSGEVRSGNDVLIVGAGPTGLLLAGDLATAGVAVTVLERRTDAAGRQRQPPPPGHTLLGEGVTEQPRRRGPRRLERTPRVSGSCGGVEVG